MRSIGRRPWCDPCQPIGDGSSGARPPSFTAPADELLQRVRLHERAGVEQHDLLHVTTLESEHEVGAVARRPGRLVCSAWVARSHAESPCGVDRRWRRGHAGHRLDAGRPHRDGYRCARWLVRAWPPHPTATGTGSRCRPSGCAHARPPLRDSLPIDSAASILSGEMIAGDRINAIRRYGEQRIDQAWAITRHRCGPRAQVDDYDGDPRLAVVTVNRSTTRYLKLMLLTLADQDELGIVRRVVVVDNGSRDGGAEFLGSLAAAVPSIELVQNRWFLNHARGMRSGLSDVGARRARRTEHATRRTSCCSATRRDLPQPGDAGVVGLADHGARRCLRRASCDRPPGPTRMSRHRSSWSRRDWLARRDVTPDGEPRFAGAVDAGEHLANRRCRRRLSEQSRGLRPPPGPCRGRGEP